MTNAAADSLAGSGRWGAALAPAMDARQFRAWAALLEERTGMVVPEERKSFLVTGVGLRMRETGFSEFDAYYEYLRSGRAGHIEWAALVDHLTVQETRFFRDGHAASFLEAAFLPEAARRVAAGDPVQIWSAGCATGEEAYTLAMLVHRRLAAERLRPYFGVTGSDISLRALGHARQALYRERRLASVPEPFRDDYCRPATDGWFRMDEALRRRVCFTRVNLLEDASAPLPSMDLVYCQNVLIYFDRDRRRRILDHLAARLRPGGLMILGAGEALGWSDPAVSRVGSPNVLAFRRHDGQGRVR